MPTRATKGLSVIGIGFSSAIRFPRMADGVFALFADVEDRILTSFEDVVNTIAHWTCQENFLFQRDFSWGFHDIFPGMDNTAVSFFLRTSWIPALLFGVLSLPLVLQDMKDSMVSRALLVVVALLWCTSALWTREPESRLVTVAAVLLLGALVTALLPGRLGEADIAFMSGMAAVFSFWSLILSLALGCMAAFAAFLWRFRGNLTSIVDEPLPFLPSLYWGGLTVALGGLIT